MRDRVERLGTVLVVTAAVVLLLVASTLYLPRSRLMLYILGWLLALVSINIRQTRLGDTKLSGAVDLIDAIALFFFVIVGFRSLMSSNLPATTLSFIGVAGVVYSFSL